MKTNPKCEFRGPNEERAAEGLVAGAASGGITALRFATREELAQVLQVSVRTVDAMVAAGEVPCVRLRGIIVRFYLPDVIRHLTSTAPTRKRGRKAQLRG